MSSRVLSQIFFRVFISVFQEFIPELLQQFFSEYLQGCFLRAIFRLYFPRFTTEFIKSLQGLFLELLPESLPEPSISVDYFSGSKGFLNILLPSSKNISGFLSRFYTKFMHFLHCPSGVVFKFSYWVSLEFSCGLFSGCLFEFPLRLSPEYLDKTVRNYSYYRN